MNKKVVFVAIILLCMMSFGSFWSWLFPSMKEGILVGGKIDSVNPVISPNAKFTLYTFMDGAVNPLVLVDNERKSKKIYSSTVRSVDIKGTTIFMESDWDSNSRDFVYTDVSSMDIILANLNGIVKRIDFKNQKDLMPNIDSGKIVFISSNKREFYLVECTAEKCFELIGDTNFKIYPKFLDKEILYIQYNFGKTQLIIFENGELNKMELDDEYQISRIYPNCCGKILIVANKNKFREDLFIYNIKEKRIRKIAEDIIGSTVFWINENVFGYVKKSRRDTVVLTQDGKIIKERTLVKDHPIEWITASKRNWIVAAIFDPKEVVTNIYLFNVGD